MKKIFYGFSIFVILLVYFSKAVFAATVNFDKTSITTQSGASFSLQVNIDAGSDEIRSTDIYLNFDSGYLQVESVNEGSFFPTVTSDTSTAGQVYLAGMVDDPAVTKTGSGTLATVNFKALKDGSTTISLNCSSSKIVKADIDATNILNCSQTVSVDVTIGSGSSGSSSSGDSSTSTNSNLPSSLPRTGIFENLQKAAKPGLIFLLIGGLLRIILL